MSTAPAPRSEPHISVSAITLWLMCPRRFMHQYMDRLPWPSAPSSLVFGSAIHAALGDLYQARLEGREPELDELHAAFRSAWSAEPKEIELKDGESVEGLDALARAMLAAVTARPQEGQILAVEEPFRVEVAPDIPPLVGVIDAIELRGERVVIREHKSAAKSWTTDQVEHSLQASAYVLAATEMGLPGVRTVDDVAFEFQILTKTKRPSVEVRPTRRSRQQVEEFRDTAVNVWTARQAGVFPRNRSWACATCPFKEPCSR